MIYLKLQGRIGNQLFQYAYARALQLEMGENTQIVIDDSENVKYQYDNSIQYYHLPNVRYVHDAKDYLNYEGLKRAQFYLKIIAKLEAKKNLRQRFNLEKKWFKFANKKGLFYLINGYARHSKKYPENILLNGYFQSEKFFSHISADMKKLFSLDTELEAANYPNIDQIKNRNTVCISIKVQHNAGNPMYDVCDEEYYKRAISHMCEHVENPLFFICSDNVQYVKDNLIDCSKYDVVEQAAGIPVHISLAAMSKSKHFIISNSTYAWWAQYMSDYEDKIVIAPKKWYGIDVPCDIYQDNWVRM